MNIDHYKKDLEAKTIDELTQELSRVRGDLDMVFMLNNSLDKPDITEGGGEPADQERYQLLVAQQKAITAEINKRHMLDLLK